MEDANEEAAEGDPRENGEATQSDHWRGPAPGANADEVDDAEENDLEGADEEEKDDADDDAAEEEDGEGEGDDDEGEAGEGEGEGDDA